MTSSSVSMNAPGRGAILLIAGCGIAGGLIAFALALSDRPWSGLITAAIALALAGALPLVRSAVAQIAAVLMGTFVMLDYSPGIQAQEVLFAAFFSLYLVCWFTAQVWVHRLPLAPLGGDRALLAFLGGAAASVVMTVLYQGDFATYINMAIAVSMCGLYFPIRHHMARSEHALRVVVFSVLILMGAVALRNLLMYRELLAAVVLTDFVRTRRVSTNLTLLPAGSTAALVFLSASRSKGVRVLAALCVSTLVPALIITQSRGQWLALLVSLFVLFLAGRPEYRRRFAIATIGALVVLSLVAVTVAGDKIGLVTSGLLGRWSTIQTSTTKDISLLSRVYEGEAVLGQVVQNPILGHGLGVPYSKYDIITQEIWTSTWVHNGYLGLLYTYGIWGVILMSIVFASAIRRGYRAYLKAPPGDLAGAAGLAGAAMCCGLLVGTLTENPFHNADGFLVVAISTALAAGAHAHVMSRGAQ